jgi:hypothetical protein
MGSMAGGSTYFCSHYSDLQTEKKVKKKTGGDACF